MSAVVRRTLFACGIVAVAALAAGLAAGVTWALAVFAAGLAIIIFLHARNLHRLDRWLRATPPAPLPAASGAWAPVYSELHRFARQQARRESELAMVLERFRNAAQALPDGIVALDGAHHVEWSNAAAQRHFGIDCQRELFSPRI